MTTTTLTKHTPQSLEFRPATPELRTRFLDWLEAQPPTTTNSQIARLLGSNVTQVSKYRNNNYQGNIEKFEAALSDFLKSDLSRKSIQTELFDCDFSRSVHSILDLIRSTNDIGLIHSKAGRGKSAACRLYTSRNPTSVYIHLTQWLCDPRGITEHLFRAVDSQSWPGNVNRRQWIADRFTRSNRLIILDNAQRLTAFALRWVFDFSDETQCPIALVGNPEILKPIKLCDQHFSRIGIVREPKAKDARSVAARLIDMHCPIASGVINDLAVKVIKGPGHSRALVKQLLLTSEILASKVAVDPEEAFRAAHTQLIRDYAL